MEDLCLNLLEATVTLYPANADGSPQLTAPIFTGAAAENLRAWERWQKKTTTPTGAKYPKNHNLVPTYEVVIGRLWVVPETGAGDWQAAAGHYVLDVLWIEEETRTWHRKTFYGVTVSEHSWEARDVEQGFQEAQGFEAEYMVPANGVNYASLPPLAATVPGRVYYVDAAGNRLLYTYANGVFTAQDTTANRATITSAPFAVTFAGQAQPVLAALTQPPLAYRSNVGYRNSNRYRQEGLICAGLFMQAPRPADLPRLDYYYGNQRFFSLTPAGLYCTDFREDNPPAPPTESFVVAGVTNAVLALFGPTGLTAASLEIRPE